MGLFDLFSNRNKPSGATSTKEAVGYGKQKKDGGHDHRYNKENDRTPAQRKGDAQRRK